MLPKITIAFLGLVWYLPSQGQVLSGQLPSGVLIELTEIPFNPQESEMSDCTKITCIIDKKFAMGAIGKPKTRVGKMTVKYKDKNYDLDVSSMYNALLSQESLKTSIAGYCYDAYNCSLRGLFGDAGSSYVAEWQIRNGVVTRTVLSDANDLVELFRKNKEPPRFE